MAAPRRGVALLMLACLANRVYALKAGAGSALEEGWMLGRSFVRRSDFDNDMSLHVAKPFSPITQAEQNASLGVWAKDWQDTDGWISKLPVRPAWNSDRVALTILQPATAPKVELMAHVIRLNMHRLGPKWALAVFYAQESEKEALSEALGHPKNVHWLPITLHGKRLPSLSRPAFSWWLLSLDFWNAVPKQLEHVLIFGDDSIVLRNSCIDKFVGYSYVGSPWHKLQGNMPKYGGNGGFRLQRRSASIAAINHDDTLWARAATPGKQARSEDDAWVRTFGKRNVTFPPREDAVRFAVETTFDSSPCAVHKPWLYQTPDQLHTILSGADAPSVV